MSKFFPTLNYIVAIFAALLVTTAVYADDEKPAKPAVTFLADSEVAKHKKTITRVQDYLSGLTTITSEFTQVAPDGSLTSGKFFLERPGMMRWQYNPPTPILMVANGSQMVYYDYELEQISYIPLDSTLIGFLAQEKIRFDNSVGIISFEEKTGTIRIGISQKERPTDGQLILEFTDKPLLIRNMVVTDASGQMTTVSLNNANFGAKIDEKLFDFRDPRKSRNPARMK
jgi:outer membrane lipoprotein-sorting protein